FYSQEGWEYINMGPEGYLWEWYDAEEEKIELDQPDEYDSAEDYRATLTPDYGITTPTLRAPIENREMSDFDKYIAEETEEKIEPYGEVPYPLVYFTSEEQKEINTIQVDLESYVEQMEAKFITGVEPLSNWDEYVETIEKMQVDRFIEIHQEA